MAISEVIRTTGDIRRTLAQSMSDVRSGELSVDKANSIAGLAKEITSSINAEVSVARMQSQLLKEGRNMGEVTNLGKMIIEDAGAVPVLSGA